MSQSFRLDHRDGIKELADSPRRSVLVTGAAGRIGSFFAEHSCCRYDLRLMVHKQEDVARMTPFGEVVVADLRELDKLKSICEGVDTVLHLAANPDPSAEWEELLEPNIIGTYNLFTAAKSMGCKRVVFASSIHAVSGHPRDFQVRTLDPVNPGDLYGVTKCFGEALARYMAEQEGISSIVVRIAGFQPLAVARDASSIRLLDSFVSRRDLNLLLNLCIDAKDICFAIVHGLSDNHFKRLDISDTRELLGYEPQDDMMEENPKLRELGLERSKQ